MKAELERARTESHDKIRLLEEKLAATQTELNTIVTQKAELDKEHEDLLVMLTEQDGKVMKYKVFSRIYSFFHSHWHGQNFWWNHGVGCPVHFILFFIFKTSLLYVTLAKRSKGVVVDSRRTRKERALAKAFLSDACQPEAHALMLLNVQWNIDITNLTVTIFFTPVVVKYMGKNLDIRKRRYSEQI